MIIPSSGDFRDLILANITTKVEAHEASAWLNRELIETYVELHTAKSENPPDWDEINDIKLDIAEMKLVLDSVKNIKQALVFAKREEEYLAKNDSTKQIERRLRHEAMLAEHAATKEAKRNALANRFPGIVNIPVDELHMVKKTLRAGNAIRFQELFTDMVHEHNPALYEFISNAIRVQHPDIFQSDDEHLAAAAQIIMDGGSDD